MGTSGRREIQASDACYKLPHGAFELGLLARLGNLDEVFEAMLTKQGSKL
jgi:hypothetical protein